MSPLNSPGLPRNVLQEALSSSQLPLTARPVPPPELSRLHATEVTFRASTPQFPTAGMPNRGQKSKLAPQRADKRRSGRHTGVFCHQRTQSNTKQRPCCTWGSFKSMSLGHGRSNTTAVPCLCKNTLLCQRTAPPRALTPQGRAGEQQRRSTESIYPLLWCYQLDTKPTSTDHRWKHPDKLVLLQSTQTTGRARSHCPAP